MTLPTLGPVSTSGIIWPPPLSSPAAPLVWSGSTAQQIPAVGRALDLICGQLAQVPLNDVRGQTVMPRPRLLEQPDPTKTRPWYVTQSVTDYLIHGDTVSVVTARDREGWPAAVAVLPACQVYVTVSSDDQLEPDQYWWQGIELPLRDVIHVRRKRHPWWPWRGWGVLEQYLRSLNRIAAEEEYEHRSMTEGAVPSVAMISPNPDVSQDELTLAKEQWVDLFGGPVRKPGLFPRGTVVQPLSWSPADSQMKEARELSLTDAANMFNLDAFWLGAASAGLTYKSPGPLYQTLLKTTLEPIMTDFEGAWSAAWLPRGRSVQFDRLPLLRDSLDTMVTAINAAMSTGLMTLEEGRLHLGLAPLPAGTVTPVSTVSTVGTVEDDEDAAS